MQYPPTAINDLNNTHATYQWTLIFYAHTNSRNSIPKISAVFHLLIKNINASNIMFQFTILFCVFLPLDL